MYTVKAYCTDNYNLEASIHRDFKSCSEMWKWCAEYLKAPNHKVIVHRIEKKGWRWSDSRERNKNVKKIGVFTKPTEIPGYEASNSYSIPNT